MEGGAVFYEQSKTRLTVQENIAIVTEKYKNDDFRRLWIVRINAAVREHGMNYSQFICALKAADIVMDRKTLAYLAMEEPSLFAQVAEEAKTKLAA